jgi:putative FmdB family regulatory protein
MPTYEFRCPDGHEFEKFYRKISDATAEVPCPECGKIAMRLVSGGAGLLFKGSGFYLTDYGKNAHRGGAPGGSDSGKSGEGSGGEGKGAAGGDSKSGDSKSSDAKSTEAKPSETKSTGDAKPAKKPSSGTPKSES